MIPFIVVEHINAATKLQFVRVLLEIINDGRLFEEEVAQRSLLGDG